MTLNISFSIIHKRASFGSCKTQHSYAFVTQFYCHLENYITQQRPQNFAVSFLMIKLQNQMHSFPFLVLESSPFSSTQKYASMHSMTRFSAFLQSEVDDLSMTCDFWVQLSHQRLMSLVCSQFHVQNSWKMKETIKTVVGSHHRARTSFTGHFTSWKRATAAIS